MPPVKPVKKKLATEVALETYVQEEVTNGDGQVVGAVRVKVEESNLTMTQRWRKRWQKEDSEKWIHELGRPKEG